MLRLENTAKPAPTVTPFRTTLEAWQGPHNLDELLRNIYADRLANSRPYSICNRDTDWLIRSLYRNGEVALPTGAIAAGRRWS